MPLDLLAIALITLIAGVALLMRLRAGKDASAAGVEEELYRQDRSDPARMSLPLSGLSDTGGFVTDDAYLPAELEALLETPGAEDAASPETAGLTAALSPAAQSRGDALTARVQEILVALTILLGLTLLLFWLISIF